MVWDLYITTTLRMHRIASKAIFLHMPMHMSAHISMPMSMHTSMLIPTHRIADDRESKTLSCVGAEDLLYHASGARTWPSSRRPEAREAVD